MTPDVLPTTFIGISTSARAHCLASTLVGFGHQVVLLPVHYVRAYVKRRKNDANDVEALCKAVNQPNVCFVAIHSAPNQAVLLLLATRDRRLGQRTWLINALRGDPAKF